MELYSGYINKLIEQFAKLPGIGSKSAQRLALHMINMPVEHVERFAQTMIDAKKNIHYCNTCYTLTDTEVCPICSNAKRNHQTIMVVENIDVKDAKTKTFTNILETLKIEGKVLIVVKELNEKYPNQE